MGRKSRTKGAVGEREVVDLLKPVFPHAERSYHQARSGSDAPDVDGTPYWIECEMSARPSPHGKMRQALDAAWETWKTPPGMAPVVFTRQCARGKSGEWLVTMRAEDWLAQQALIRAIEEAK